MDYELIRKIVNQQFESTPEYVTSVGWGLKYVNGKATDDMCLTYNVLEKKPLHLIPEEERILPTVSISGHTFKTDVCQAHTISTQFSDYCNQYTTNFNGTPPNNRNYIRPLKGGISSINFTKKAGYVCTLGFLAIDNDTGSLVGVSNNHCYVKDAYFCSLRNPYGFRENEESSVVIQPADYGSLLDSIGVVKKYVPLTGGTAVYNRVDGACTTINQNDISYTESWKQEGLTINSPMPFATTSEINSLVGFTGFTTSPNLFSSGRTTGPKGEQNFYQNCKLQLDAFPVTVKVNYNRQGVKIPADFENQIRFRLFCPDYSATTQYCRFPVQGGDSGSALLYETSLGQKKILGLAFACDVEPGTNECFRGYANRIDDVANELNLSAWTGQTVNFSNTSAIDAICLPNTTDKTIVIAGKTYWQLGFCLP